MEIWMTWYVVEAIWRLVSHHWQTLIGVLMVWSWWRQGAALRKAQRLLTENQQFQQQVKQLVNSLAKDHSYQEKHLENHNEWFTHFEKKVSQINQNVVTFNKNLLATLPMQRAQLKAALEYNNELLHYCMELRGYYLGQIDQSKKALEPKMPVRKELRAQEEPSDCLEKPKQSAKTVDDQQPN